MHMDVSSNPAYRAEDGKMQQFIQRCFHEPTLVQALREAPAQVAQVQGFSPAAVRAITKLMPHLPPTSTPLPPSLPWWR